MAETDRRSLLLIGGRLLLLGSALGLGSLAAPYVMESLDEIAHEKMAQLIRKVYKEEKPEFLGPVTYFDRESAIIRLSKNYASRALSDQEFLGILTLYLTQQNPLAEGENNNLSQESEPDKFGQRPLMHFGLSDAEAKQFQNSTRDSKKLEQIMQESLKRVIDSRLASGLGAATFQYPTEFGLVKKSEPYISSAVFDSLPSSIVIYNRDDVGQTIEIADENKIRVLLRKQNFEAEIRSNGIFSIGDLDFEYSGTNPDVADFIVDTYSHVGAINSFKRNGIINTNYVLSLFYFNKAYGIMLNNLELKRKNNEFTSQENRLIDMRVEQLNPINADIKKVFGMKQ